MTKVNEMIQAAKENEGKKVLYFEGAGCDFEQSELNGSDVLNYRIRTSFINNDGEQYYLEMGNVYKRDSKGKNTEKMGTRVDHFFNVADRQNVGYEINVDWKVLHDLDYTKENLTKWINEICNCSFDTIHVIDRFYGYHVHGEQGIYNLMEDIELNHERAVKRRKAYENIDTIYKTTLNEKYSVIGLMEMNDNSITIKTHVSETKLNTSNLERVKVITV